MTQSVYFMLMTIATVLVMLFQLRTLIQSTSADYYSNITQAVLKLTNPLVNVPLWARARMGSIWIAGFVVAFILSEVVWVLLNFIAMPIGLPLAVIAGAFLFTKSFGYLIIVLLLAQALCSWLPSTRNLSFYFGQLTQPIVAPVQRIIPPIGMIDISLMIVLIALYALNHLIYKVLAALSQDLMILWAIV